MVLVAMSYSVGPIITLPSQITAREYMGRLGNQVHLLTQTLFRNNSTVLQDNAPIHTAVNCSVQSWFEEHEGELQHLPWLLQTLDLNITDPVLETKVRT
jgi:hypothetical protein